MFKTKHSTCSDSPCRFFDRKETHTALKNNRCSAARDEYTGTVCQTGREATPRTIPVWRGKRWGAVGSSLNLVLFSFCSSGWEQEIRCTNVVLLCSPCLHFYCCLVVAGNGVCFVFYWPVSTIFKGFVLGCTSPKPR